VWAGSQIGAADRIHINPDRRTVIPHSRLFCASRNISTHIQVLVVVGSRIRDALTEWRRSMIKFGWLGAVAILSMAATPVFAQPVISEPGSFAFYHPDGDLGIGSTPPAANAMASIPLREGSIHARSRMKIESRRPK
jgi:hypothetical protein